MKELGTDDVQRIRAHGAIDLPTIQRFMNYWFSSSLDLFGAEQSSNAAMYFATGIKGRPDEAKFADHIERDTSMTIHVPGEGLSVADQEIAVRNGMNDVTRTEYVKDCNIGVTRWNMLVKRAGSEFQFALPSTRFRREVGLWKGAHTNPQGERISAEAFEANKANWLPSEADFAFIHSLMKPCYEPGKMAAWIAPPDRGINAMDVAYDYVRL
jgi:benzoyl-CoA 2,3-epoxidase subunit B